MRKKLRRPYIRASFKTMRQASHVAVLGAGPSLNKNIRKISKWVKKNKAVVIAANYTHRLRIDYTVFVGRKLFLKYAEFTPGVIIVSNGIPGRFFEHNRSLKNRVMRITYRRRPVAWEVQEIKVDDKGRINHNLPSAGFSAILLSIFCRPQQVLISGFDGPVIHKGNYYMDHFFHDHKLMDRKAAHNIVFKAIDSVCCIARD